MICADCRGKCSCDPVCETCGGCGITYCCEGGDVDKAVAVKTFVPKPEWAEEVFPIVKAE